MHAVLLALGIASGILTTLAGQGGGMALLLACSALFGPRFAIALTTPALLLGNLHRAALFRAAVVPVLAHAARIVSYGAQGSFRTEHVAPALVLTAALLVGNAIGERLRIFLTDRATRRLELAALFACAGLSVAGLR